MYTNTYGLECFSLRKTDVKSLDFAVVRFLMTLFSSTNIDTINICRWYFDFQLAYPVRCWKKEGQVREKICGLQKPTPLFRYFRVI